METTVYNVRRKTYIDGTQQFMFYSNVRAKGFTEEKKKTKKGKGNRQRSAEEARKRAIQKVYDLAKSNKWDYFITLTLNKQYVNRFDYDSCCALIKLFTKKLRDRKLRYLIVPEQHENGAWHFHGLVQGRLPVVPAVTAAGNLILDDKGRQIYNIDIFEYGFTTATSIDDSTKAAAYCAKYVTKDDAVPFGKKRYWASRGLNVPEVAYHLAEDDELTANLCQLYNQADFVKVTETQYGRFELIEIRGKGDKGENPSIYPSKQNKKIGE